MILPITLIGFSVLLHLFGYYTLFNRIEPFQYHFYIISWWSYIIFADACLALKKRTFLVLNGYFPFLVIISSGFWCFFEIINTRLENWYYINLTPEITLRYFGYLVAYGTVIPGIYVTKELVSVLIGAIKIKPLHITRGCAVSLMLIGAAMVPLMFVFPSFCFFLTWIFLALILDSYNYLKGGPSFIRDFQEGHMGNFTATMISGFVCGLLWEAWNYRSVAKWVYTVPFFENLKLFEMPLPGYLGFLAFGVETIAFVNFLNIKGIYKNKKLLYSFTAAALVFSIFSFAMIDRYTVFSYTTAVNSLSFVNQKKRDLFRSMGMKTSYSIDTRLLDKEERESMELLHLKGLGLPNFQKLREHGIRNVHDLSNYDEETLSKLLGEANKIRLRVLTRAARTYIPE